MLIRLRNDKNKLVVKDMLDIDFDMMVEENDEKEKKGEDKKNNKDEKKNKGGKKFYRVRVNSDYTLDGEFENEEDAEDAMIWWSDARNMLETELRQY